MEQELFSFIAKTLPRVKEERIRLVVEHLLSDDVGLTSMDELPDLQEEYLSLLPPLPRSQLIRACKEIGQTNVRTPPVQATTQSEHQQQAGTSTDTQRTLLLSLHDKNTFKFTVPWDSIPAHIIDPLKEANENNTPNADMQPLKLAIAKKLWQDYKLWKLRNPGSKMTPGIEVYKDVSKQVYGKFKNAMKIEVNGKHLGNGYDTFLHVLKVCIDNLSREKADKPEVIKAKKARGVVGVVGEKYCPRITPANKEKQAEIRETLMTYHDTDEKEWNWEKILADMATTYELQRESVVEAKASVDTEKDSEENEDDNLESERAFVLIKRQWPFLFRTRCLRQHHNNLTGRDINSAMKEFMESKLEYTYYFLTSASNANAKNLALRVDLESNHDLSNSAKLLLIAIMAANHFQEDGTRLLLEAERTALPSELDLSETKGAPCIVALGEPSVCANKFVVCADNTPLIGVTDGAEALCVLFEMAFVFDLEYPDIPFTMEFLERYVFGMGFAETRVTKKNGRTLLTLSDAVKKMITSLNKFSEDLAKASTDLADKRAEKITF